MNDSYQDSNNASKYRLAHASRIARLLVLIVVTVFTFYYVKEYASASISPYYAMSREEANHVVYARDEARELIDPKMVGYYSKTYGVDREEALERLITQAVVPNLRSSLERSLGDDFSGLWFDNETGKWVVQIAAENSLSAANQVLSRLGLDGYSRLDWVDYSADEAQETQRELGDRIQSALKGNAKLGQIGLAAEAIDLRLPDTLGPEIRKRVAAIVDVVTSGSGKPPVEVRYVDRGSLAVKTNYGCSFPNCALVTGGVRMLHPGDVGCTAGFKGGPASEGVSSAASHWYTAGHCVWQGELAETGTFYRSDGSWYFCRLHTDGGCSWTVGGSSVAMYRTEIGDAALLASNGDGMGEPNIARWKGTQTNYSPVRGWYTNSAPVGTTACYAGATSGSNCGTVSNSNFSWSGLFKGMIKVEDFPYGICPTHGDSGGP